MFFCLEKKEKILPAEVFLLVFFFKMNEIYISNSNCFIHPQIIIIPTFS